jgi:single-stranded-DNA-specific exonuclease
LSKNKPDIVFKQRVADAKFLSDESNLHPLLQRIFSARGLSSYAETRYSLAKLLSPDQITQLSDAAKLLAQHIHQQSSIMILGDYDADGATSTALCVRALNMLGHNEASFLLPDRVSDGYGVSANVAQRVIDLAPQLVITVDTGIASFKGLGMFK